MATAKKAAAKKPAAKKAPAKKAPAKKAPAKKAAAKKPAAKKAPAKKAPAKKAAAKKAPAKKAAAKKAPAKKAPAKKAPARATPLPVVTGEPMAVSSAPTRPKPPRVAEPPAAAPAAVPALPPAATTVVPRQNPGWVRWLVALTVLLLAAAVGLGVAALVVNGPDTYRSDASVQLVSGPAPSANVLSSLAAGQRRYVDKVPSLTDDAAQAAGVPRDAVTSDLRAVSVGGSGIELRAEATDAAAAVRLADAGARVLVTYVKNDQVSVTPSQGDRLSADVLGSPTRAELVSPTTTRAALAGAAAGGSALLLLALGVLLVRRSV